jgi:hypothetical protein
MRGQPRILRFLVGAVGTLGTRFAMKGRGRPHFPRGYWGHWGRQRVFLLSVPRSPVFKSRVGTLQVLMITARPHHPQCPHSNEARIFGR